jgi:putative membrane protein
MVATWVLGVTLAFAGGWYQSGWFHAKFALVLGLSAVHGMLATTVKKFAADANERPARFFRILNEVPTALMVGIVVLVIVKPF